jgi:uncharacterized protein YgiM (DUF1202 family)
MKRLSLLVVAASLLATPALASAFWHGTVTDVPNWDVLNVRKWPATSSAIIDSYNNGDDVSMTGRCKNTVTNVSFRIDGGQSSSWKFNRMSKANVWCQVVTGSGAVGWVRGKFVWPD